VASVGHRPRGLFAFEYCLPNGLFETDYWSHYLPALEKALFVREIQYFELAIQKCDRHCEGSQSNQQRYARLCARP